MFNTRAIAEALVQFLREVQDPGTNAPLYKLVKLGTIPDPTELMNYCEVTFERGVTERYDVGWRLQDRPVFLIESGVDHTDSEQAEIQILTIRDLLIPLFLSQVSLNQTQGVKMTLLEEPDDAQFKSFPNGRWYRTHQLMVTASVQYNIQLAL